MKRTLEEKDIPDAKRLKLSSSVDDDTTDKASNMKHSNKSKKRPLQVTICGGGNGAHAFVVTVGASLNPKFKVNWLSLYSDESERINNKLNENNGYLTAHFKQENLKIETKPNLVTNDPSKAIPGSDIIILCVPAFAHAQYLDAIKKFHEISNKSNNSHNTHNNNNNNNNSNNSSNDTVITDSNNNNNDNGDENSDKKLIIAAFPSQSGLEFLFLDTFFGDCKKDKDINRNIILFSCLTLPWACRIHEYGELIEILALKSEIDVCCWFKDNHSFNNKNNINNAEFFVYLNELQSLFFEEFPKIRCNPDYHILSSTLGSMNPIGHGAIMYDKWKDYKAGTHFNKKPLFYHGITPQTAQIMSDLSTEVVSIGKKLDEYNTKHEISHKRIAIPHVVDFFYESYGDVCTKTDSLYNMIMTNPGYDSLTHPMKLLNYHETVVESTKSKNENEFELQWVPDWNYRYLTEDIPFGLLVIKAIHNCIDKVDGYQVNTPVMDQICLWSQKVMRKKYFIENKETNKIEIDFDSNDIKNSRIPQVLGFDTIDDILRL